MAGATRMKNLESQVQQFHLTVTNLQARVELLEIESNRTHAAIMAMDRKLDSSLGGLERRMNGIIDEVRTQFRDQLQNLMVMFYRQNQSSMNGSISNIPKSTGRSFATSFYAQSGAAFPVFHHAGTIQGVQQPTGSFSSGCLASNNLPIALSQISNGSSHDHSRGQDTFAEKRDADFSFSQGNFSMSYDHESSSLHQQQIQRGEEFWRPVVAGKKLREIAEEVEDFAEGNKTPVAVLFFTSTSKSKLLSTAWGDDLLAEIEVTAAPNANAHKQPWYECPRQICNLPLLHFEDAVDIFQCAAVVHHGGVGTTAAGIELELYQIAPIEVLGRITTGIDLGYLRTWKKKRPRRTRKERKKNQIDKAGIG